MNKVFDGQVNDGKSAPIDIAGSVHNQIFVTASGGFGGGTVTLELSPDGLNWITATGVNLTAPGQSQVVAKGLLARLDLSGATLASLTAWLDTGRA